MRFISMYAAAGSGGSGGMSNKFPTAIMERKIICNVSAVKVDKFVSDIGTKCHHGAWATWRLK